MQKPQEFVLSSPQEQGIVYPDLYLSPNPNLGSLGASGLPVKRVDTPYSDSISAGKNTYVYDAHTYHTKVPPQGIEPLIEYYTRPGDVVLDPFCGSGMTGVAATQIGRKAILSDLSPAATFIAYNLNTPIDTATYLSAVESLLAESRELESFLYDTRCRTCSKATPMLYTVWSYGLECSNCNKEFLLWDVARDERPRVRDSKIKSEFTCPHCAEMLKKRRLKRTRRYPVQVGYKCCHKGLKESTATLDEYDLAALDGIEKAGSPRDLWYPTSPFPIGMNTKQPIAAGITTIDKAYTPRALWAMAYLWNKASKWTDERVRLKLLFTLTSLYQRVTIFSEFRFWGGSGNIANFNVPAIINEQNVFKAFARKANTISWYFRDAPLTERRIEVSTQSACHLPQLPDKSVDYIFTDPPFGGNINYSEMNFLWESWLGKYTDNTEEAIVNKVQRKGIDEYKALLTKAFQELRRVLKNNGWLTVVFHNSSDRVWNALQRAISDAGFVIKGTQTFDKEHGTFKQFVSDNTVGYDLVLHCQERQGTVQLKVVEAVEHKALESTLSHASNFVREAVSKAPQKYVVGYLHVTRDDEFDYRRLYADWLAGALPNAPVILSFEQFRSLTYKALKDNKFLQGIIAKAKVMRRPKTLSAFTPEQQQEAHKLLATRVAFMMGRKFEEGDWAEVYCRAKDIPLRGWSNLEIDIMHGSLGVEHKMLCYRSHINLLDACGKTLMHPSATRSIRVPSTDTDPDEAMRDVLRQYAELIEARRTKVFEQSASKKAADMRTGWLLWQESLRQFLYFEEEMLPPNPDDYTAKWVSRGSGTRKASKNLWVYEKETGHKRYSITTEAGAKIQPYFDVPSPTDPNLYLFTVIGEVIDTGLVKVWITEGTARELKRILGSLSTDTLSCTVRECAGKVASFDAVDKSKPEVAEPVIITVEAYEALQSAFPGVSDEHCFQLLTQYLRETR